MTDTIDTISDVLRSKNLKVERIADTLNVAQGVGRLAHKANIDPTPLLDVLQNAPPGQHARLIAGFASGVKGVLAEPMRSTARTWTYALSAGRMMPNIEVDTFSLGVTAAGEDPPWTQELGGGLVLTCYIELDRGYRILNQSQVEEWGATQDRVYSAARSMLFHKTRDASRRSVEGFSGVEQFRVGDGYDAIRSIVVTDVFFTEMNEDAFRFSMPHQDVLLFTETEDLSDLTRATDAAFADADYPLSSQVFRLERGRPTPVEAS